MDMEEERTGQVATCREGKVGGDIGGGVETWLVLGGGGGVKARVVGVSGKLSKRVKQAS